MPEGDLPPVVEDVVRTLTLPITAASVVMRRGGAGRTNEGTFLKLTFTAGGSVYVPVIGNGA